jgi:hypothetical protein
MFKRLLESVGYFLVGKPQPTKEPQPKPRWRCNACKATCVSLYDLKCGDANATFPVNMGGGVVKYYKRATCPLEEL